MQQPKEVNNLTGALWMIGAVVAFSAMGALGKYLSFHHHPLQVLFFRCFFALVLLSPFFLHIAIRRHGIRVNEPRIHIIRTFFATGGLACTFYSLAHLDLATATALFFTRPLFFLLLAIPILGEVVGWRRGIATAIGFAGMVVIVNPGAGTFEPASAIALAAAFSASVAVVCVKILSDREDAVTILFLFTVGTTITSIPGAIMVWSWPTGLDWLACVAVGIAGTIGQACMLQALKVGEATVMNPIDYAQIVVGAIIGYVIFSEIPPLRTWVGAAIITGSTLYILFRTQRRPGPYRET